MLAQATTPAIIDELEAAMDSSRSDRRVEMLRRVTDLLLVAAPSLNDEQATLFDGVIELLADRIDTRIRRELAEKLAFAPNAPLNTTRALARDEIEVARSILANSTRLGEQDLIEIASSADQEHLLAITGRRTLTESLTDVLVQRGNQDVVRSVAGNTGARFSDLGFETLVQRSEGDEVLQERIGARSDLPAGHLQALMAKASERVKARLVKAGAQDGKNGLTRLIGLLADDVLAAEHRPKYNLRAAELAVADLQRQGLFGELELMQFAVGSMRGETIVGLARLSKLPVEVVEALWAAPQNDGLIILVRSLGFNSNTLREVLKLASSEGTSADELNSAIAKFNGLRFSTAQRVVRFWLVRHSAQAHGADAEAR